MSGSLAECDRARKADHGVSNTDWLFTIAISSGNV
jgi:hypothetical protein